MHECPNCGGYCYCDQEDTLVVLVIQCSHLCPEDDGDFDYDEAL